MSRVARCTRFVLNVERLNLCKLHAQVLCFPFVCVAIAEFIPNDIQLGVKHQRNRNSMNVDDDNDACNINNSGDDARLILLTGPNMGGKSTIMRQVCIVVILAQLGCYGTMNCRNLI